MLLECGGFQVAARVFCLKRLVDRNNAEEYGERTCGMNALPSAPYRLSVTEALGTLASDAQFGLTSAEARARRERYGSNELAAEKPVPAWRKFLAQFRDGLVILLLIATVISATLWLVRTRRRTAL